MPPASSLVFGPLDLSQAGALIAGGDRIIYQHPQDPAILVKVIDQGARDLYLEAGKLRRWHKRFRREGAYRVFICEATEFLAISARALPDHQAPLARVLGIAQTTCGTGLLVEKISDGHGELAPTLDAVVRRDGLTPAWRARINQFFDDLSQAHVVVHDMSPRNIAVGCNAGGEHGLYLVDGFGVKQAIPLYAMSRALNTRHLRRQQRELLDKLGAMAPAALPAAAPAPHALPNRAA